MLYSEGMSPSALVELEEKTQGVIDAALVSDLVDLIYALDVSDWTDEHLFTLEHFIDRLIHLLSAVPNPQHRALVTRLFSAREGIEQGLAPDPAKRLGEEALMDRFAAGLRRAKIA